MGPVRQNPIQRTVSLFICVCIALCTIVAHNIAQNRPDSFPPYPPDDHHSSDDVYLREGGVLSSNMSSTSSTCPHNMVNFGPLAAEIDQVVWGTPANFNGFRVLAALLHGI